MWTYLQRWQITNSLYHLQKRRDGVRWVEEYDLCAFIGGTNMRTHIGPDNLMTKTRARLSYFFFGVNNHDDLFTKIRNIINECEDISVNWITRAKHKDSISDYLNLTTRGREIYPLSHLVGLFFGNYYVKWATTLLIVWSLAHWFNFYIQPK